MADHVHGQDDNDVFHFTFDEPLVGRKFKKMEWSKMGGEPVTLIFSNKGEALVKASGREDDISRTITDCTRVLGLENEWNHLIAIGDQPALDKNDIAVASASLDKNGNIYLVISESILKPETATKAFRKTIASFLNLSEETDSNELLKHPDIEIVLKLILAQSVAHECYHIRQFYHDRKFFDETMKGNRPLPQTDKLMQDINYVFNPGEMAARAFSIRFLVEQRKRSDETRGYLNKFISKGIAIERDLKNISPDVRAMKRDMEIIQNVYQALTEYFNLLLGSATDPTLRQKIIDKAKEAGIDID